MGRPTHTAAFLRGMGKTRARERMFLGVGDRCAVVAAHPAASPDGALLFAQVATRWADLLELIVLETHPSRWMNFAACKFAPRRASITLAQGGRWTMVAGMGAGSYYRVRAESGLVCFLSNI